MTSWKNAWQELEHHVNASAEKLSKEKGKTKEKQIVAEMQDLIKFVAKRNDIPIADSKSIHSNYTDDGLPNIKITKPNSNKNKNTSKETTNRRKTTKSKKKKMVKFFDKCMDFLGLEEA